MSDRRKVVESRADPASRTDRNPNLIQRFVSMILGEDEDARARRRLLKNISKGLKRSARRYLSVKARTAEQGLAQWFYDLYRIFGPIQAVLKASDTTSVLKRVTVDLALSNAQLEIRERLSENVLEQRFGELKTKELFGQVNGELKEFGIGFDKETLTRVNLTYYQLQKLLDLINFDYYYLLKKFDTRLPELDFLYLTRFRAIGGEQVLDDLKDFLEIVDAFQPAEDWTSELDVLRTQMGSLEIEAKQVRTANNRLLEVKRSRVFEAIVRFLAEDPFYTARGSNEKPQNIVDAYFEKLRTETHLTFTKIARESRSRKIVDLASKIFGTENVSRLVNYTEEGSGQFKKHKLDGYLYVAPLNFVRAFLLDFFKRDVREMSNVLVVRGNWSANDAAHRLSAAYHTVAEVSDSVTRFDQSLGADGEIGLRIRAMLGKPAKSIDRDQIRNALGEINDIARGLIQQTGAGLVEVARIFKVLIEDYAAQIPRIITNWSEVRAIPRSGGGVMDTMHLAQTASRRAKEEEGMESRSLPSTNPESGDLGDGLRKAYTKIYQFTQLLQQFSKE